MMGFGEEAGVIPRFCQELFSRLASVQKDKVCGLSSISLSPFSYDRLPSGPLADVLKMIYY
jgi:hypothetical protein